MQECEKNGFFSVSGTIAGAGEFVLPIHQGTEWTGSFAVSLKGETPAAGLCIALPPSRIEPGWEVTVKETAALLYRVVESKAVHFTAVIAGFIKTAYSKLECGYKTFRRAVQSLKMRHPVLLSRAGGLRL